MFKENRFLHFSEQGPNQPQPEAARIDVKDLAGLEGKKESSETESLKVDQLVQKTNDVLKSYEDKIKILPGPVQQELHDSVVQYFMTSADKFDENTESGMNKTEFEKYSAAMLQSLQDIVARYVPDVKKDKKD